MTKYVKPKEAAEIQGLHEQTRRWEGDGRLEAIRTPSRHRRYDIESYVAKSDGDRRKIVAHARVSGRAQQPDLNKLFATLSSLYPPAVVVAEKRTPRCYAIGGGLNFKRKKLQALLEQIVSGNVRLVVVAYFDRLARRGFDLFRWLGKQNGWELVVFNERSLSREREIVEDMLAILHSYRFAEASYRTRLYGLRKDKAQV